MSGNAAEILKAARDQARARAENELQQQQGFSKQEDGGGWRGAIDGPGGATASVQVTLPAEFPDCLPVVRVVGDPPAGVYAHVEPLMRLCLAPRSGTLVDADRPEQLVRDAIARARSVLFPSDHEQHAREVLSEFMSYWPAALGEIGSICAIPLASAKIVLASLSGGPVKRVFAESKEAAETWAGRLGQKIVGVRAAFGARLDRLFAPPRWAEDLTLNELQDLVTSHAADGVGAEFAAWLQEAGVPCHVLLVGPLPDRAGHVVFAAEVPPLSGLVEKEAQRGFRPGHVPKTRMLHYATARPVVRHDLCRLDAAYLVARGGGNPDLLGQRAVIVGCGAVGSHVAVGLAAGGLGRVTLIDNETLTNHNVHRHVLGVAHVGQKKVVGLADVLGQRFPHLNVVPRYEDVLRVMSEEPALVTDTDVIVVALGDETLERRLNRLLVGAGKRVHVWLEPMGLGGHVLGTGYAGKAGCYECLYRIDDKLGLVNMASLAEPGQIFQRTTDGCSGTFTPFGMSDAQDAAAQAVREAIRMLTGEASDPVLRSWLTSRAAVGAAGYYLSPRGNSIAVGTTVDVRGFARPDCATCGEKAT